ncbi:MAG: hypothetical protein IPK39_13205 [Sulfuritalea sp.]|nr:hypothetical protein [Sulfuritalea sp.]
MPVRADQPLQRAILQQRAGQVIEPDIAGPGPERQQGLSFKFPLRTGHFRSRISGWFVVPVDVFRVLVDLVAHSAV